MIRTAPVVSMVFLSAAIAWSVYTTVVAFRPVLAPPIAGASAAEQRSEAVSRGFALGRQYQATLLNAHGDSWLAAARHFEDGLAWDDVRDRWASQDRIWRDEPFDRLIQPEIDRILGPDSPDNPEHRRAATLFIRAFAAGLKDRR